MTRFIYHSILKSRFLSLPAPKIIFTPILWIHYFFASIIAAIKKLIVFFYWQPLFSQYLEKVPKYMDLSNTLPCIVGSPSISIGEYCTINGAIEIFARTQTIPGKLILGNNVFIGHNVILQIGSSIEIGDHCLIAAGCILRGYLGHPLDAEKRKAGLTGSENDVGSIILEPNVWLGQNVTVNKGVRIGENSVIASGSIVTRDIPAQVIAGGIPARVIRSLLPEKP